MVASMKEIACVLFLLHPFLLFAGWNSNGLLVHEVALEWSPYECSNTLISVPQTNNGQMSLNSNI
jgi:hypothetical protein